MKKNILVLTDSRTHQADESIYFLLQKMLINPAINKIFVVDRANEKNADFFSEKVVSSVSGVSVDENFLYENLQNFVFEDREIESFDVLFLRIDRPVSVSFFHFIETFFDQKNIINNPNGMLETGAKNFLENFSDLCPPMKICYSINDLEPFLQKFSVVLKPLNGFGGRGLIKIENEEVLVDGKKYLYKNFVQELTALLMDGYLAMKFLKNVTQGDKRVIVVNGEVVGAAMRFPAAGSYLCNCSQGGTAAFAEANEEEHLMAKKISEILTPKGVVMFGFDTLVNDDGKRVLSEINTMNVGGIYPTEVFSGRPVVQQSADLLCDYIEAL